MPKIINGEIVADDDPRLKQPSRSNIQPTRTHIPLNRTGASPQSNTNFLNLPSITLFGQEIHPQYYLLALAACLFFGTQGILIVSLIALYYYYQNKKKHSSITRDYQSDPTQTHSSQTHSSQTTIQHRRVGLHTLNDLK